MIIKNIRYEKGKYFLKIDDLDEIEILEDTLVKFNLYKNMEIDFNLIDELINHNDLQKSINLATKYLINIKTKKQIRDYLKTKNMDEEIIEKTIVYLEEKNYTDDLSFSKSYLYHAQKNKKYGINKVRFMLLSKGVESKDIDKAFLEYDYALELKNCLSLLEDKLKEDFSQKNIDKAVRFLIGRGFNYDTIKKSLEAMK